MFSSFPSSAHWQGRLPLIEVSCHHCGKTGTKNSLSRCAGCKMFFYCGRKCQKKAWKIHKPLCKYMTIGNPPPDTAPKLQIDHYRLRVDVKAWMNIYAELFNIVTSDALFDMGLDADLQFIPFLLIQYVLNDNVNNPATCMKVVNGLMLNRTQLEEIAAADGEGGAIMDHIYAEDKLMRRTGKKCAVMVIYGMPGTIQGYRGGGIWQVNMMRLETFTMRTDEPALCGPGGWVVDIKRRVDNGVFLTLDGKFEVWKSDSA